MAASFSTGSPTLSKKSPGFVIFDENEEDKMTAAAAPSTSHIKVSGQGPTPLQSDKLANAQPKVNSLKIKTDNTCTKKPEDSNMDNILARMRDNQQKNNQESVSSTSMPDDRPNAVMDKLIADLQIQKGELTRQEADKQGASHSNTLKQEARSSGGSDPYNPTANDLGGPSSTNTKQRNVSSRDLAEVLRIRQELADAKSVITRQEQELAESRNFKHTIDQAMGPPSEVDFGHRADMTDQTVHHLQGAFNAAARPFTARTDSWHPHEDARSDNSEAFSTEGYGRGRAIWHGNSQQSHASGLAQSLPQQLSLVDNRNAAAGWSTGVGMPAGRAVPPSQRVLSGPSIPYSIESRFAEDGPQFTPGGVRRTMSQYNRPHAGYNTRNGAFSGYGAGIPPLTTSPMTPISLGGPLSYQPRPIGTPLSATASEFNANSLPSSGGNAAWSTMNNAGGQTYVTPLEPMNYRRLLDKSVSCDWKYIVDKIVCSNDQQASIFLQQKLKLGTAEQKFEIVEAIVNQAYPLMINRFGNFLVQRCFEHGTPDQVTAIADAIHGNVLSLSMDAFGCHVIQKAFDSVPENHKADMVRELLRRIPDTVIHRYACHVWQKLFELRWSGEPPQIMLKVNEALRGMWHEVALGETGSLVVQNIFENCVEEEKRPAIEEVIASIDLIAHGQFGNWCIQHLCEHGSPPDKRRVVDHILANAYNYSIDQFASKVVEKCLKIGGPEFMERYLAVVTTAHPDRPRIPLIDISGDQYGNYLVQWILMNTSHHQREQVASHIRKHMVSLRGSKFGSRVAMLCCNPASVTRPGPGVIVNPFGAPGQPRGCGWGRFR